MPHSEYLEYMKKNVCIGLVCLDDRGWEMCVPSKIFELINLEIPILGILPNGDASRIINSGYGLAVTFEDAAAHFDCYIETVMHESSSIKKKMKNDKENWYIGNTLKPMQEIIRRVQ